MKRGMESQTVARRYKRIRTQLMYIILRAGISLDDSSRVAMTMCTVVWPCKLQSMLKVASSRGWC